MTTGARSAGRRPRTAACGRTAPRRPARARGSGPPARPGGAAGGGRPGPGAGHRPRPAGGPATPAAARPARPPISSRVGSGTRPTCGSGGSGNLSQSSASSTSSQTSPATVATASTACRNPTGSSHRGRREVPRSVPATVRSSRSGRSAVAPVAARRTTRGHGSGRPSVARAVSSRSALSTRARCTADGPGSPVRTSLGRRLRQPQPAHRVRPQPPQPAGERPAGDRGGPGPVRPVDRGGDRVRAGRVGERVDQRVPVLPAHPGTGAGRAARPQRRRGPVEVGLQPLHRRRAGRPPGRPAPSAARPAPRRSARTPPAPARRGSPSSASSRRRSARHASSAAGSSRSAWLSTTSVTSPCPASGRR